MAKKGFDKTGDVIKGTERALIQALTAGAVMVHGEATVRVPIDLGNLKSSLSFEVDEGKQEARVGTNTEYAPWVEYGTSKQGAQPYLRPSLDDNTAKLKRLFSDILKKGIEGAGK